MPPKKRHLSAGEIAMAKLLFGDALDYARVRVFSRRYLPYLQPKNCAMTPKPSFAASRRSGTGPMR